MSPENQTTLTLDNGRFTLTHPGRRPRDWDFTPRDRQRFDGFLDAYREALGKRDREKLLLRIGRNIRDWLGDRIGDSPRPPWHFVIQTSHKPDDGQRAFLAVPWELIADQDGHWVAQPHLRFNPYRRLGLSIIEEMPPSDYRLSVLFMAAAPPVQSVLDFEGEEMAILSALGDTAMDLEVEESGMLSLLSSHTDRFSEIRTPDGRSEQAAVEVIHLSCHGGFSSHGEPGLYLEDETGTPVFTRAEDFRRYPNLSHGGLLFLSACHTAEGQPGDKDAHDRVIDSLTQDLLLSGFRAVLGWDGAVGDGEATAFAAELYRNLARKADLAEAVGAARHQLFFRRDQQGTPLASRDWHLARLFLGMEGGGPLTSSSRSRRSLDSQHGVKEFLDTGKQVPVAARAEFVGRRRPIQRVLRAFRERESSGVLIHGMGRQGKSSLAARVASRLSDLQPVVVFGHYQGQDVLRAFADAALGRAVNDWVRAHEPAVRQDPARMNDAIQELLRGPLRKQPVLLILDDLERILAPSAHGLHRVEGEPERETLAALIRGFKAVPGDSRLLITARYRFTLPDDGGRDLTEALLSLPLPPMDAGEQQKQLRKRRLLLEEAKEDAIHPEDPRRTGRCLALAQGNPGLQDLLYRLSRREPAACDGTLDSLEDWLRGRSLADIPDDADAEEIRNLLEGLALTEIGKALTDGERALLGASGLFALPVPEKVMARLMDAKSPDDDGFQPRAHRLVALGLWDVWPDPVHPRQSALAINPLARSLAPAPDESDAGQWAGRCIETLAEAWMPAPDQPPRQSQANGELTRLALLAGFIPVIETCAEEAVAWLYQDLHYREAAAMGREALEQLQKAGIRPPLGLLRWSADALAIIGDTPAAREYYRLALDLYRAKQGGYDYNAVLRVYANQLVDDGQPDEGLKHLERVLRGLPKNNHPREHAITLGDIARIKRNKGQIDEALALHLERLTVHEQLGDQRSRAVTLGDIARIKRNKGEIDEALALHQERLTVYEQLGDQRSRAITLGDIAGIKRNKGQIDGALELHQEELSIYEQLGDQRSRAVTLGDIARIKGNQGQIDEALELHQEELSFYEQLGDQRSRAITLGDIGAIHLQRGEPDKAQALYEEQWEIAKGLGDVEMIAHARWFLGKIANAQQDVQGALEHFNAAYQTFVKLGRLDGIAMVGWDLGFLLCAFGTSRNNKEIQKSGRTILTRSRDALRQLGLTEQAEQVAARLRECGGGDDEGNGDGGDDGPEPSRPASLARRVLDKIKRHH